MADWRQIQARIRKAKAGGDALAKLVELYEKTRDAMVAFELARMHEKSGQNDEAARWYTAAAERFRRAQWKAKAQEALTRLGASVPPRLEEERASPAEPAAAQAWAPAAVETGLASTEPPAVQAVVARERAAETAGGEEARPERPHRKRRGRRGGRRRRHGQRAEGPSSRAASAQAVPDVSAPRPAEETLERAAEPSTLPFATPARAHEPAAAPAWQARGRAGEPALASRLAQLESQLRRLIASPLYRLDEADQAPAGPGVFIVSDSEQTAYYYIEACQTLRVAVANLLRGERGARRGESLRPRFADHLGISESRVSKYLKDHCAVRWLQLDEGAPPLAHFAIAVLRPALND